MIKKSSESASHSSPKHQPVTSSSKGREGRIPVYHSETTLPLDGAGQVERLTFLPRLVSRAASYLSDSRLIDVGHTILHELTHLDAVGSAGGLSGPPHGTDDYQTDTNTLCELLSARNYLAAWRKDQQTSKPDNEKLPSPDYNAESYAAAGTGT
jgi:hypothetical protein